MFQVNFRETGGLSILISVFLTEEVWPLPCYHGVTEPVNIIRGVHIVMCDIMIMSRKCYWVIGGGEPEHLECGVVIEAGELLGKYLIESLHHRVCNMIMFLPRQRRECFMLLCWLCWTEISPLILLSYIELWDMCPVHTLHTLHTGGGKISWREKYFIVQTSSNWLTMIFFEKMKNC